jgi:hypothetical protein
MKLLLFVLIWLTAMTCSFAQLSIPSSDYLKNLNILTTKVRYVSSDTSGLTAALKTSGAGAVWSLTGRPFTLSETTTEVLLVKSTSGAPSQSTSAFSSANYVMRRQSAGKPGFTDWTFMTHSTTALSYNGYASDSAGILKSLQTNSPAERIRSYPTTYPGSWSWSSTVTSTSYTGGSGVGVGINMSGSDVVDGYGTVTTPEGTFQCLRIKSRSDMNLGFFTITSYQYDFVDQNRTIASISAGSTGIVPGGATYYLHQSSAVHVEAGSPEAGEFHLSQNYPNPFNPTTAISYHLSTVAFVSLKVFDVLGNEVGVLVEGMRPVGTHTVMLDARHLPSGVYFYRLTAGDFVQTKRFTLIK